MSAITHRSFLVSSNGLADGGGGSAPFSGSGSGSAGGGRSRSGGGAHGGGGGTASGGGGGGGGAAYLAARAAAEACLAAAWEASFSAAFFAALLEDGGLPVGERLWSVSESALDWRSESLTGADAKLRRSQRIQPQVEVIRAYISCIHHVGRYSPCVPYEQSTRQNNNAGAQHARTDACHATVDRAAATTCSPSHAVGIVASACG